MFTYKLKTNLNHQLLSVIDHIVHIECQHTNWMPIKNKLVRYGFAQTKKQNIHSSRKNKSEKTAFDFHYYSHNTHINSSTCLLECLSEWWKLCVLFLYWNHNRICLKCIERAQLTTRHEFRSFRNRRTRKDAPISINQVFCCWNKWLINCSTLWPKSWM